MLHARYCVMLGGLLLSLAGCASDPTPVWREEKSQVETRELTRTARVLIKTGAPKSTPSLATVREGLERGARNNVRFITDSYEPADAFLELEFNGEPGKLTCDARFTTSEFVSGKFRVKRTTISARTSAKAEQWADPNSSLWRDLGSWISERDWGE